MNVRFVPLAEMIADEWDKLVYGSPDGWAFSLSGWQRLILRVPEFQLRDHSFATYENGSLIAVMPLQSNAAANLTASTGWGGSGPVLAGYLNDRQRARIFELTIEHSREIAI